MDPSMIPPGADPLLDVKQVATLFHIGVRSVWRRVKEPDFPKPIAIGKLKRWRKCDIDRWLDSKSDRGAA